MAGIVEAIRHNTIGFLKDYFLLLDVRDQNRKLKRDNDKLRMENVFYRNQLATAEHARALTLFQAKTPSRTVAARVIGDSTVSTAKAVFIDRGSTSNIEKGMAVVTPDGIVGKVAAVYPLVSQVLLVTDSTFKVGVESQKGHIHGTLNCGIGHCVVEQIQNEEDVAAGRVVFHIRRRSYFPEGLSGGNGVERRARQRHERGAARPQRRARRRGRSAGCFGRRASAHPDWRCLLKKKWPSPCRRHRPMTK